MSATPGEELLRWQARQIAPTLPAPCALLRPLRPLRVDLEKKVTANHDRIRRTTTDVVRIGGARTNARWTRKFMAHDPREDLRRITVPVLAITGAKDLQVRPDLDAIASCVRGTAETRLVPDLTHTLRRRPGPPSLGAYEEELRRPLDADLVATVVEWCSGATHPTRPRGTNT